MMDQEQQLPAEIVVRSYHLREGRYFERLGHGRVRIRIDGVPPMVIAPEEWASIVASMSHRGEDYTTYKLAYVAQMGPLE